MRRLIPLLVVVGMFWQAMGMAGQAALASTGEDVTHALLHWSEAAHLHHDDGSFDHDDSDAAARHVLVDDALSAPTLCFGQAATLADCAAPRPADVATVPVPSPVPDRLRRPPRLTA